MQVASPCSAARWVGGDGPLGLVGLWVGKKNEFLLSTWYNDENILCVIVCIANVQQNVLSNLFYNSELLLVLLHTMKMWILLFLASLPYLTLGILK